MKMNKIFFVFAALTLLIFIIGCDKGIEPLSEVLPGTTGFSGKVTFEGNWPAGIKRTHLVVFKSPILTSNDFFPPNLAFVIDSIPYRSSSFSYNSAANNFIPLFTIAPGEYQYVVVAQSKTPDISLDRKDWVIVGIYCIGTDQSKPRSMIIQEGRTTTGIDITVNYNNPPPQPPM